MLRLRTSVPTKYGWATEHLLLIWDFCKNTHPSSMWLQIPLPQMANLLVEAPISQELLIWLSPIDGVACKSNQAARILPHDRNIGDHPSSLSLYSPALVSHFILPCSACALPCASTSSLLTRPVYWDCHTTQQGFLTNFEMQVGFWQTPTLAGGFLQKFLLIYNIA